MALQTAIKTYHHRVDEQLKNSLVHNSIEPLLQDAMRYALFNGGKRVRPLLVYLVNQLLNGDITHADSSACAIECVHSYSLVHDDLPAMDDDELRRGKPTCHIAFDEATAILAGDALQCFAFELLSSTNNPANTSTKLQMISVLARASGDKGMVAGQAFDLSHVDKPLALEQLKQMHAHKTGALINAAIELGYLSAECQNLETKTALLAYGEAIGLAFQVKDDILDIEGDTQTLGKPQGSDLEQNKPTYPALLGMEGAKAKLDSLHRAALDAMQPFGEQGKLLRELADYIVNRSH
ncbi:polyprenyl synthetase family protein [Neptunomonas japonica]|uniref:Geranylgeranyl diphosphate synthase, type II n=1 Tax=Neptunomonas japonica JAMM 1380 TaxID=1441457 RepID=A0A7R6SUD0_9GAMM|nr:farnesyl diphosphate synthase [Neptunomonas japonica]BBB28364.1 geranylgeranyl diphosphate synthase, type II [Neptunomonas japonica JAMM 1380]